jgi:hypothetical protein
MVMTNPDLQVTVYSGVRRIAEGPLRTILQAAKAAHDAHQPLLILDDATARAVDLDLRGDLEDALARLPEPQARGRGRPKLGVVAREVTLLPRHWEWLARQPGGASVALRKLVEAAARSPAAEKRQSQEVAYRAMSTLAGDLAGFEEAARALFASDRAKFMHETQDWPPDVKDYVLRQAAHAFSEPLAVSG